MLVQGRRRPFPAGPKRANKQRARARPRSPIDPNPDAPDGRHERRRRARFPLLPAMPDRPRTLHGFRAGEADRDVVPPPRNGRDRGFGGGLVASLNPPGRTAGSPCCLGRGRCGPTFSGRGRRRPDKAIRPGNARWCRPFGRARWAAGASPVSRGICGRPWGGPIPARSSSSPVNRPYGRVIAHPALPDVGGPGIAPLRYQESNGAVCSDPSRRRPRPGFQAMTKVGGHFDAAGAPQVKT